MITMTGMWMYIWLAAGFVFLIKGADFFVDGSSSIAKFFNIPRVIIGLTIVAMGTSAPETAVSISAALKGANEIAVSNVVGSNFFNLLAAVGICAIIKPVKITGSILKRDFPCSVISTLLLLLFLAAGYIFTGSPSLTVSAGIIMLIVFVSYIIMLVRSALSEIPLGKKVQEEDIKSRPLPISIILIITGLAGVIAGGNLVVDSASAIASRFGMSDTLIGLTIVAIGTSLPELVTSIAAAGKGEADMALGNVIGSNIFNILFVLGLSSAVHSITVNFDAVKDTALLILANLVVFAIVLKNKNYIKRNYGILMVLLYIIYTLYIILRNYNMIPF